MKRYGIIVLLLFFSGVAGAQFKSQGELPNIGQAISKPSTGFLLNWLNPEKFRMQHTFSASFVGFGGGSMMMNSYMNTIDYQISNPLALRLNIGLANTPYTSFETQPGFQSTQFFGGAELEYRPSDKMMIKLGVGKYPNYGYMLSPYDTTLRPQN